MESIQEPNSAFPFSNLILTPPTNSSGGNHFMKFSINDNPLYIQIPKCKTKQVVSKSTSKRAFLDLMFTNENEEFIQWVENLEAHCQKFIYSKRERWFDSTLEESDIENLFTSILKPMKMGKLYLLRVNTPLAISNLKIYDENENLMSLEELKEDANIICILEFQGIKCSARGFQVEIEVKQVLVLKPTNIFDRCILSKKREANSETAISTSTTASILESPDYVPQIKLNDGKDANTKHRSYLEEEIRSNFEAKLDIDPKLDETNCIIVNTDIDTNSLDDIENITDIEEDIKPKLQEDIIENTEKEQEHEYQKKSDKINSQVLASDTSNPDLLEIDFNLEEVPIEDSVVLKQRNDVYYEMYKEALKKAKMAKDLALSSYLEAKRIKNLYMLDDLSDDSELEDFVGEEEDGDEPEED